MRRLLLVTTLSLLGACSLEVEQHPGWRNGGYNNKPDNLSPQSHFHKDRLAWNATITNRNHLQNEYNRTTP